MIREALDSGRSGWVPDHATIALALNELAGAYLQNGHWEDAETLNADDDWTEFTLNADARGTRLWLQVVEGRVQFDWAEVTFDNGDTRVVDMKEWTRGPG